MEAPHHVRTHGTLGADARRQSLGAGLLALALGATVAAAGPTRGSLLIGGAFFLTLLLVMAWCRPDACVAGLAFLIPLQVRLNLPGNWSLAIGFVLISSLALVVAYREIVVRESLPVVSERLGPALAIALFASAAAASLWVAADLVEAARRWLYLGWFLALLWLVPRCVRDSAALLRVVRAIVTAAALVALLGIVQFTLQFLVGTLPLLGFWLRFVTPILEGERVAATYHDFGTNWILWIGGQPLMRAIGPFSGPPDVAQYLGVSLPLAVAFTLQRPRLRARDLALLALLLLFLVLTFSRQAWVGIFLALVVICLAGSRHSSMGSPPPASCVSRRLGYPLAAGVLAATLVLIAGNVQREGPLAAVVDRLRSIGDRGDVSNMARFDTWLSALSLAEEHPVVGAGLGNYATAVGDRRGAYSHSTYLDVLAETGPVGLLGLLLLLAWAAAGAWQVACRARQPELQAFGLGALGSVVALALIFFFDDAFYFPRAGQAFWLLLGLIVAGRRATG
jgi:O-antigen ligase